MQNGKTINPPLAETELQNTNQNLRKKKEDEFPGSESKKRLKGMRLRPQSASSAKYTPSLTLPSASDQ